MKKLKPHILAKTLVALIALGIVFATLGCRSPRFYLPGEKRVRIQNIYTEYYNIAEQYFGQKNYTKAAEYYSLAASSKKLQNAAVFNAARSYALAEDWQKALSIYKEIERADPKNIEVKQAIAYIYAMTGNFNSSEKIYKDLIEANPNVSEILVNYIIILLSKEKYEDAKENLVRLKQRFPDNEKITLIEEKIAAWEEGKNGDDSDKIPEELRMKL